MSKRVTIKSKYASFITVFLIFILQLSISCTTTKNNNAGEAVIKDSDVEIITWSFNTNFNHANYTLLALNNEAAEKNPQLNELLNTLLYKDQTFTFSGQTAHEYLNSVKKAFVRWDGEGHEEKLTWEIRGRYFLIERVYADTAGSSYEHSVSYIIDTALIKRLSINDIITNSANTRLQNLLWNRLKADIDRASFRKSMQERTFSIFFKDANVVFHWDEGILAPNAEGAFNAELQRSEVLPYLTAVGKEILALLPR